MRQKRQLRVATQSRPAEISGKIIFKGRTAEKEAFQKLFVPNEAGNKQTFKFSDIEALSLVEELSREKGVQPFLGDFDADTVIELTHLSFSKSGDNHTVVASFGHDCGGVDLDTKQLLLQGDTWSISVSLVAQ